ncbi:metallophosphoesterase MPPED2-like [Dreissena polymorpha]|uniref:Calcineurin-like phosphoesterase domain-containing protein n=1 Tax=Dreissena polymorpha TaxID=45954 RepID=A0A9D4MWC7_DREPO|nr:metallophosphoesterase MPPED2-like [Dreissena polymorpha]KAH3884570.1 hypothetical protein DPMN_008553 [Dreissena polymorpha]
MQPLTKLFSKLLPTSNHSTFDDSLPRNVGKLKPDKHSGDPTLAWDKIKGKQNKQCVKPVDINLPVPDDRVRFVCISDTHTEWEQSGIHIPDGDILLHAGDMTMSGQKNELEIVKKYLDSLPHKHKVVIAGNHDLSFDHKFMVNRIKNNYYTFDHKDFQMYLKKCGVRCTRDLFNDIYLEDSMVKIYGINIYGSPWTPGSGFWGFQCCRGAQLMSKWNMVPNSTDVLLTHMPPLGYGDNIREIFQKHVGCVDLLKTVQTRVKPAYHVYGHIHEGYGMRTDGTTIFVNAAVCDEDYNAVNSPIIFDIQLPKGVTKQSFGDNQVEWVIPTETLALYEEDIEIVFEDYQEFPDEGAVSTGGGGQEGHEVLPTHAETILNNVVSVLLQSDAESVSSESDVSRKSLDSCESQDRLDCAIGHEDSEYTLEDGGGGIH